MTKIVKLLLNIFIALPPTRKKVAKQINSLKISQIWEMAQIYAIFGEIRHLWYLK